MGTDRSFPDLASGSDPETWLRRRAPELRRKFRDLMYGEVPMAEPLRVSKVTEVGPRVEVYALEGKGGLMVDVARFRSAGEPRGRFIGINFHGNHTVSTVLGFPVAGGWHYPEGRKEYGAEAEAWNVDDLLARGFEIVTFAGADVLPDDALLARTVLDRMSEGRPLGAIGAWGWALACVARTFVTSVPTILVGHSRMGKAALVAGGLCGAGDAVVSIQSGSGGAAPSRTSVGETFADITRLFPHWFVPRFSEFAGREADLPFDQHALLALCAPRPVFLPNADADHWANPGGQERMAELARPVYRLLGRKGDEIETWARPGGHSVTREDWRAIIDFVERRVLADSR